MDYGGDGGKGAVEQQKNLLAGMVLGMKLILDGEVLFCGLKGENLIILSSQIPAIEMLKYLLCSIFGMCKFIFVQMEVSLS